MEMLCASPCVTTLLCFSLEKRYRMHRAWDENAWMNQHRLAARGNATTFPLAWENLVEQLQGLEGEKAVSLLPRTGQQLAEVVRVLIKSNAGEEKAESVKDILHQATVRRDVVLRLIEAAVRRKHPAYRQVSMEQVALKARDLPEHGVPPEVVAILPHDTDLDNLQPQKVATPVPECVTPAQAASELGDWLKPNAVVCEKSSVGAGDLNAQQVATLKATVSDEGKKEESKGMDGLTLTTGNRLFDQFKPEYFGMAFPHVFKFCSAMPDPPHWSPNPRHRRAKDAPRLELSRWVRAMARRCEAQVGRDWVFGFTSWNLLFRSALNLSRAPVRYTEPVFDEKTETRRNLTAKDIEAGAVQLLAALQGTYVDMRGQPKPVKGDISKLPYVRNLQPAARRLLQNMRTVGATLPGTQEARRRMRFEIEAMRIKFGVPLFVTFSPDEAHQLLYVRMSRTRQTDPVRRAPAWEEWMSGDRDFPHLVDEATMAVHIESTRRLLPTWEQRRATLARDPLASVDGFRMLVQLVLTHLFGLQWLRTQRGQRVCTACQKRGQWTCSVCKTRRLQTHFSLWAKNHKGQHGRQQCNICIHMMHARERTHARLQRRRRKVAQEKVAKVLQEVRAAIQQAKTKKRQRSQERPQGAGRTCTREEREEERKRGDEHVLGLGKGKATEQNEYLGKGKATEQNEYECPDCQAKTYSIVRTGTVHVAGHCGKQFRVRNGDVVRSFTHACPSCGTQVQSAKASGRIQSKHKKPNGKACPTTVWVQK